VLKPKETTALIITYATSGLPGPFKKTIDISTDADTQETEIVMTGEVREAPSAKIQVDPRRIDITVPQGTEQRQIITIRNTGNLPLVIKKIYSQETGKVYLEPRPELVIEPGKSVTSEINIIRRVQGMFREMIVVETNARNALNGRFMIMATGK